MATIKATAEISAFCMPSDLARLHNAIKSGDSDAIVSILVYSNADMSTGERPWPRVGTATVEVAIMDEDGIRQGILGALKAERANVQAEAQKRITEIDGKIQDLLAISYDDRDRE